MGSTLDLSDTEEIGLGLEQAQQSQQSQADLFTRALLIPAVLSGTCVCLWCQDLFRPGCHIQVVPQGFCQEHL